MTELGKVCTKCKIWKLPSEFHKNRRNPDGRHSWCKNCRQGYAWAYRAANCEKINAQKRDYYSANRERIAIRGKAYRRANHEKVVSRVMTWRKINPDRVAAYRRAWHEANPDKSQEYAACRRARKADADGSHTRAEFRALCEQTGWVCLCCGTSHEESPLTVDHVVPLSKGGSDSVENIQPLCLSCNDSKGTKTIDYQIGV